MQWWQKHQKHFDKTNKNFCSSSGIDQKMSSFNEKKVFPRTFLRDIWTPVLTTPPLSCRWNAENISLKIRKQKKSDFLKKVVFIPFFHYDRKNAVMTTLQKKTIKDQNYFTPCPKTMKNKLFLKKSIFHQYFSMNS